MFVKDNSLQNKLIRTCSYIDGEWLPAAKKFDVINPYNQISVAKVCEITKDQLDFAIYSSNRSFKNFQSFSKEDRINLLQSWQNLISKNKQQLAKIITLEQGKPLLESEKEISYSLNYFNSYIEELKKKKLSQKIQNGKVYTKPVGVVSAITPWNFPVAMILRKAIASFAAGCSFIVKPSELTPLSALALAELSNLAKFPKGLFNVVVGKNSQKIGKVLTQSDFVAKFTFTGSTSTGKKLLKQCSTGIKKTSMELGGNAPFIVFEDCDIDKAVEETMASKFRNAGQTCISPNRFFIHKKIFNEYIKKLILKINCLELGNGFDLVTTMGPLIEKKAKKKIDSLIKQALKKGAKKVYSYPKKLTGNFYPPTILTDINSEMEIFKTEIFGPVIAIIQFENEDEVIELANSTAHGLCAYAFTESKKIIQKVTTSLEFGMIGINSGSISNAHAPFGGKKQSGYGREGGVWGLDDFLETLYVKEE